MKSKSLPTTPRQLTALVRHGEGATLEFKRSTGEMREAMETLCGMLNASGHGRVLFGVSDQGRILGQTVAESTRRDIANASGRIEPAARFKTTVIPSGKGQTVISLEAIARDPALFTYEGRGFLRVENTTQKMSRSEYDRHVARRLESQSPWDRCIAADWKIRHLDRGEIRRTIEEAVDAKRLTGVLGEKAEVILRRLKLVTDRGVTRAAAILFGKEDGPGFPSGEIRLARFRGVTKDEFRDNRQYTGSAFALLQHAERFLDEHVPVASRFEEGRMRRIDTPLYPPLAVREALVNALVHRDYSMDAGAVSIALFDDRLEIWSTGILPHGLTPKKLMGTHESIPRNRLIADVFHRRGLIERWGRGTNKMLSEAAKHGCPEPEFEEITGAFVVRFRPAHIPTEASTFIDIGVRGEQILAVLRRSKSLNTPAIQQKLPDPISASTLKRELRRLLEMQLIVATGKARSTTYRLPQKAKT